MNMVRQISQIKMYNLVESILSDKLLKAVPAMPVKA